ncbi:MAG: cytochrome P450 [Sporichthyaceae bacterium]
MDALAIRPTAPESTLGRHRRRAEDVGQLLLFLGRSTASGEKARRSQVPVRAAAGPHVSRTVFDPVAPDTIANPYPVYAKVREGSRAQISERHDVWVLHRYQDVRGAARDAATYSNTAGIMLAPRGGGGILAVDPPDHDRLRSAVSAVFTKAALRALTDSVHRRSAEGVAALRQGATVDAVSALCVPLPVGVICDLLGVPEARMPEVRAWSNRLVGFFGDSSTAEAVRGVVQILPVMHNFRKLISDELVRRERQPSEDLIQHLATTIAEGNLTREEALLMAFILLVAGNETTVNLLGSALHVLSHDPVLYDRLRAEPALVPAFVEETMRLHSPVQWTARQTTRDVVIADESAGDITIPARSRVVLMLGAANRDPEHFPDPETFQLDRRVGDHLGFGAGIHFCLGAHLTRLEVRVALEHLLETVPSIEPAGPVTWAKSASLRGPVHLPLRVATT